jgi:hypothetical protein
MTLTIDGFVFGRSNVSRPGYYPGAWSRREPSACTAVQPRALHDRQPRARPHGHSGRRGTPAARPKVPFKVPF